MWFGITYLSEQETGDAASVVVSIWDEERSLRVGGAARSVADIICALREAGGTATALPRCGSCKTALDVPDLDAEARAA